MEQNQTVSPPDSPTVAPVTQRPLRGNTVLMILSIVVAIDTLLILALGVAVGFLWGERSSNAGMYSAPSAEEQEMLMFTDQMATEVGYLIVDNDLEGYLRLYDPNDPHVDRASVESEFTAVAQKAQEAEGGLEYYSDMMPTVYEDEATGETIIRASISGSSSNTGRPAGGRLTVYVLYDDGDITLTGRVGRNSRARARSGDTGVLVRASRRATERFE